MTIISKYSSKLENFPKIMPFDFFGQSYEKAVCGSFQDFILTDFLFSVKELNKNKAVIPWGASVLANDSLSLFPQKRLSFAALPSLKELQRR